MFLFDPLFFISKKKSWNGKTLFFVRLSGLWGIHASNYFCWRLCSVAINVRFSLRPLHKNKLSLFQKNISSIEEQHRWSWTIIPSNTTSFQKELMIFKSITNGFSSYLVVCSRNYPESCSYYKNKNSADDSHFWIINISGSSTTAVAFLKLVNWKTVYFKTGLLNNPIWGGRIRCKCLNWSCRLVSHFLDYRCDSRLVLCHCTPMHQSEWNFVFVDWE